MRPATAAESAELAAAGGRHFRWRITAAGRAPLELRCSPEATAAELAALYPGAILEALPDDDQGDDGTEAGGPKASLTGDDRRRCTDCANLAPGGRCRAAARGELPYAASRRYEPAPDLPKRCEGFAPRPGDPDRRPGRERWPGLMDDGGAD